MKLIPEEIIQNKKHQLSVFDMCGFDLGVSFSENEYENILMNLIQSIFDYENQSGSKIIDFDRTPKQVYEEFVITKICGH